MKKALAEIEARELAQHLQKALRRGLVEAVKLLDLLDARRVHTLAPAVDALAGRGAFASPRRVAPLELRNHLLDGTARDELDDDECDEQNSEQGRNHQQHAFEYV